MTHLSKTIGLYIHVPFCPIICPYCAFYKQLWNSEKEQIFTKHLLTELEIYHNQFGKLSIDSIYFGGGTPNTLSQNSVEAIIDGIKQNFNIKKNIEITMEMNPDSRFINTLDFYKKQGINRVSIGIQSFDENILTFYGRNHTRIESINFLNAVQHTGFNEISIDIIFGAKNHSNKQLLESLKEAMKHHINHISLYGLTIEQNTPFERQKVTIDDDHQAQQYTLIQSMLKEYEYKQYEISNFSKKGSESKHNIKYWTFKPFIGVGAGAHSFFMGHRYHNIPNMNNYINPLISVLPKKNRTLDITDWGDYLSTRLRYRKPISRNEINQLFSDTMYLKIQPKLIEFEHMGWISINKNGFMLSDQGCLIIDELIAHLV